MHSATDISMSVTEVFSEKDLLLVLLLVLYLGFAVVF